jgi:hypothetical protein
LLAFASIGVLGGLLTGSAVGGVSIAIGYHLVATVLARVDGLHGVHPTLLPYWLGRWTTLAETNPHWTAIGQGAATAGVYVGATVLIGQLVLRNRDVTA